jgi:RNA polymerase sporulation-specific sigma factor
MAQKKEISTDRTLHWNGVTNFTVDSDEVTRHIPLLKRMIKLYGYGSALSYEEKFSAGLVGIALALEKYDPEKDVKFSYWISYQIDCAIRTESRRAANQRKKHALPDPDETFDPIDEKSWSDRDRVDELEEQGRLTQLALEVIETLPARDRAIVKKMYVEGKTQCEIAAEEGVAQSWVSRVAKSALGKVRREMIRRMEREK